jgi:4'-phosphopantetheinyl transferase
LDRNRVDLRWLETDRIEAEHWPALERLLGESERDQAARFRFERDRRAYVAAHALVRTMLSRHAPVAPPDWRFAAGPYGRPEISNGDGIPPLRFNLAHTHGLAAVAVTLDNDIGVDAEALDRPLLTAELAADYFSPAELAALDGLPADRVADALYGLWTLKEAYIKAVGLGLSLPLDSFSVTLDPPSIAFPSSVDGDPAAWLLRRFRPTPSHDVALALRHPRPAAVTVEARAADARTMPHVDPGTGRAYNSR